jgi:tubulin delta
MADHFPELTQVAICVVPHMSGEVILQSYNACFSLGSLYESAEGCLLVENDTAHDLCLKQLHIKKPALEDMNRVISHGLLSVLYPSLGAESYCSSLQNRNRLDQLLPEVLLFDPRCRLLSLKHIPEVADKARGFDNDSWSGLEKRIVQMARADSQEYNVSWAKARHKLLGAVLYARGPDLLDYPLEGFEGQAVRSASVRDVHCLNGNRRAMSVLCNSQKHVPMLEQLLDRASGMMAEKAYSWQYEKYGLDRRGMAELLGQVEQINFNYQSI